MKATQEKTPKTVESQLKKINEFIQKPLLGAMPTVCQLCTMYWVYKEELDRDFVPKKLLY